MHEHGGGGGGGFDSGGSSLSAGFDAGHHSGGHSGGLDAGHHGGGHGGALDDGHLSGGHGGGLDARHDSGAVDGSPADSPVSAGAGGRHRHHREAAGDLPGLSFPSWEQRLDGHGGPVTPASRGARLTAWAVAIAFIAFIAYVAWHIVSGH